MTAGTPFTVTRTYTISGQDAPVSFGIAYYESSSPDPAQNLANATFLGEEIISAAADKTMGTHSATSPTLTPPNSGTEYLLAQLDPGNVILESNETNNVTASAPLGVASPIVIANGQAGYSETGTWQTETVAGDYGGTDRYARSTGAGNTATWQATGLTPGLYTVQLTWPKYPNQATNAPFGIYDGSILAQTVTVDETQSPVGAVYGGATFQQVATVNITSGTLKVVLSNNGTNNTYIIANAVRIVPVPPTNTDLNWTGSGAGITGPATANTQGTFTVNRAYTISGAAAPSSFAIAYYASTSPSLTQDLSQGIYLGSETISAATDLSLGTHMGTSPAFQINLTGSYYLFARLNANNDFAESDGTNDLTVTSAATSVTGAVSIIIGNGQSGYSETGTWQSETVAGDYGGTDRYAHSTGSSNTARWQANGLSSGQYTVQLSWPSYSNQATNAPFAIYDGTTLVQTVAVDETKNPVGAIYVGATFQKVATVNIASGTLKVILSNTGTNNIFIVANAVRIAPATPTSTDLNWTGSGAGISGPATAATQAAFTINRTFTITGAAAPSSFAIAYYASTSPSLSQDLSQAIYLGSETIALRPISRLARIRAPARLSRFLPMVPITCLPSSTPTTISLKPTVPMT